MRVAELIAVGEGPELIQTQELEHVLPETVIPDNIPDEAATEEEVPKEDKTIKEENSVQTETAESSASTEENLLLAPKPISNPLLKSVLDITPPTPRDASLLQIAIEEIHPSHVGEETTSPVERKEGEVKLPTEVCEFPVISKEEAEEGPVDGINL